MKKVLFCLFFASLFLGCQSYMEVERKTYHNLQPGFINGKSFNVILSEGMASDSLEFASHSNLLSSILKSKGMCEAKINSKVDFIVVIDFKIFGENKVRSSSVPHFRTTGGTSNFSATTYTYGTGGGYNTTSGTVNSYPTLEYAGSSSAINTYTEYTRVLSIKFYEFDNYHNGDKNPIYETQAFSSGSSRDTSKIVPLLIKSLMSDFPSTSGLSDTVEIPFN